MGAIVLHLVEADDDERTDRDRDRAFIAERARRIREMPAIQRDTFARVRALLEETARRIDRILKRQPGEYQQWSLTRLRIEIAEALDAWRAAAAEVAADGADRSWVQGQLLLDAPLAAAGVALDGILPAIDDRQLAAMKDLLTRKIRGASADMVRRIDLQLGLVITGLSTPARAATETQKILRRGGRARALTIVRTELGAVYSAAQQVRQEQATTVLPGLKKQWRRSGKIHPRFDHVVADGQVKEVKQPFLVGGDPVMYPRAPELPARHRINCGCVSLPFMERWQMSTPGRRAFTAEEIARHPQFRNIEDVFGTGTPAPASRPGLFGPGSEHVRGGLIRTLDASDPKLARAKVGTLLVDDGFRQFHDGTDRGSFPVAVLDDELVGTLGAKSRIVRLSAETRIKQLTKHPDIGVDRYREVQRMLDRFEIRQGRGRSVQAAGLIDGRPWRAVVKATADGGELYLSNFHRVEPRQVEAARKSLKLIRSARD